MIAVVDNSFAETEMIYFTLFISIPMYSLYRLTEILLLIHIFLILLYKKQCK